MTCEQLCPHQVALNDAVMQAARCVAAEAALIEDAAVWPLSALGDSELAYPGGFPGPRVDGAADTAVALSAKRRRDADDEDDMEEEDEEEDDDLDDDDEDDEDDDFDSDDDMDDDFDDDDMEDEEDIFYEEDDEE